MSTIWSVCFSHKSNKELHWFSKAKISSKVHHVDVCGCHRKIILGSTSKHGLCMINHDYVTQKNGWSFQTSGDFKPTTADCPSKTALGLAFRVPCGREASGGPAQVMLSMREWTMDIFGHVFHGSYYLWLWLVYSNLQVFFWQCSLQFMANHEKSVRFKG